jgi:flagellar basal-body rod modification protein FlgD
MYAAGVNGLPVITGSTNSQVVRNPDPDNPVIKDAQDQDQDFMLLMIEQLKNQDPLNPMQSQEFTNQLAALNSLETQISIKGLIEDGLDSGRLGEATQLIGRYVEGVDAEGSFVNGFVDRVEMIDGLPVLKVEDKVLLVEQVFMVDDEAPLEA